MTKPVSALYHRHCDAGETLLRQAIARGIAKASFRPVVFFRADDIGIPSAQFSRMTASFMKYHMPLALAVVPGWLNIARKTQLFAETAGCPELWCWHQHGYRHLNFEPTGKKQEFGAARPEDIIRTSLQRGQEKLSHILEEDFCPIFTPPWNRCSAATLKQLHQLGFAAISRSRGAQPQPPNGLPDLPVNVDLHTRKEPDGATSLEKLLMELEAGLSSGWCGIMLHHQRMNEVACEFLDILLSLLQKQATKIDITDFPTLITSQSQTRR